MTSTFSYQDLESGNLLAKQLEYLGGAASAGIVLGARAPILLTSRADPRESRIASCAVVLAAARRLAQPDAIAAGAVRARRRAAPRRLRRRGHGRRAGVEWMSAAEARICEARAASRREGGMPHE